MTEKKKTFLYYVHGGDRPALNAIRIDHETPKLFWLTDYDTHFGSNRVKKDRDDLFFTAEDAFGHYLEAQGQIIDECRSRIVKVQMDILTVQAQMKEWSDLRKHTAEKKNR